MGEYLSDKVRRSYQCLYFNTIPLAYGISLAGKRSNTWWGHFPGSKVPFPTAAQKPMRVSSGSTPDFKLVTGSRRGGVSNGDGW